MELSQKRLRTMRQHYEDKLMQLQERIRATQDERDKVLASFSKSIFNFCSKVITNQFFDITKMKKLFLSVL